MKPMDQKQFSRHLRQAQNTYEELLWQLLRNRKRCNKKFRRQHVIGAYVADFYCAEEKLVIFTEPSRIHDQARDQYLLLQGMRVLRFTGKQVELETESVLAQIDGLLGSPTQRSSSPAPFSSEYRGEGE